MQTKLIQKQNPFCQTNLPNSNRSSLYDFLPVNIKRFFPYICRPSFNNHKLTIMKKILFASFVLALSFPVSAQINKGQWLVGGSIGFESSKFGDDDDSKVTSFSLSPNAGYFFINNLAGGARLNFQRVKEEESDAASSFLFAPFLRYYFLPVAQKVNIFADASYGFGSIKFGDESESYNQFAFGAGPAVFLSPNTALEFTLQYRSEGGDAFGGDDRQNHFGLNIGFQIHLGK
jgi:hypothetical protein